MKLGRELGADVPYCIKGGTMLAEGIGDELTEMGNFSNVPIVILKPRLGVSTAWVYKNLDLENITDRPDTELLVKAVLEKDMVTVAKNMKNVLETVTIPKYNVVALAKRELLKLGAEGSMMSGSGPSVFGIFRTREKAQYAYYKLKLQKYKWDCYLTNTMSRF
jgi:4-diphosphocytidyl-2-C-methyl-D-erythritol kinase